ncbi:hypothetical protein PENTCL1PPCAC_18536, partial [Pristionchus entomophagus]
MGQSESTTRFPHCTKSTNHRERWNHHERLARRHWGHLAIDLIEGGTSHSFSANSMGMRADTQ